MPAHVLLTVSELCLIYLKKSLFADSRTKARFHETSTVVKSVCLLLINYVIFQAQNSYCNIKETQLQKTKRKAMSIEVRNGCWILFRREEEIQ